MKRLISVVLLVLVVVGIFAPVSEAALSSYRRRAVVLEAFYALRPSHDGSCDKTISGNCVSNWNYLDNDYAAYNTVKSHYGCGIASKWSTSYDSCTSISGSPVSFFDEVYLYGYGTYSGNYGNIGRGGQCKYFADLILYRSGAQHLIDGNKHTIPTYPVMRSNLETNLNTAKPGDILITTDSASYDHTAIIVEIKVDGLDVIDTNWISDNGALNREVISRHLFKFVDIQGKYGIWKGTDYYSDQYIPIP